MPAPVTKPYLVLGEGKRDQLFFGKLCDKHSIANIQFDEGGGYQGYEKLLKPSWSARTGFDALQGLVVVGDNDPNEGKTFKSIREQLQRADLASPAEPLRIARKKNSPPVVILMMPFSGGQDLAVGALESLLIPAIERAHPKESACFNSLFQCIEGEKWASASSRDKLKVRCILSCSSQANPMAGVEEWFRSNTNLIPLDDPEFLPLVELLRNLPIWFGSNIDKWTEWKATQR